MKLVDSLQGRRVLVTGHTGFKGAWLCEWLLEMGAEVFGFALEPAAGSLFDTLGLVSQVHHDVGDVRDLDSLSATLVRVRPDLVIHMAAQALVRRAYAEPLETLEVNVMGTLNLLEALRRYRRPCVVIIVTSDKCYALVEHSHSYTEDDRLGGNDPYSASKACAEILTSAWRHSYFHPAQLRDHGVLLASARAGNVLGGGDWAPDRIMPDIVRALTQRVPALVRNPSAIRPWQYVLDALSGYLVLASHLLDTPNVSLATAWNFGPSDDRAFSVRDLVETVIDNWGEGSWNDASDPAQPVESSHLQLSVANASNLLAWRPVYDLSETVAATVGWYQASAKGRDMLRYSRDEIARYQQRAREMQLGWAMT